MSCLDVRERLAEFALGTLRTADAQEVERHLEWCAGCRKEAAELQEGVATVAFGIPLEEPPHHLEREIVGRIATAAGRRKPASHRGIWALAAATFAAMLVAVSAFGWAVAERQKALSAEQLAAEQAQQLDAIQKELKVAIASFPQGTQLQAELAPLVGIGGFGRATIGAIPKADDFIFLSVILPSLTFAPYSYEVEGPDGERLAGGGLGRYEDTEAWISYQFTGKDLASAKMVTVRDRLGRPVMSGTVRPYTTPSPLG